MLSLFLLTEIKSLFRFFHTKSLPKLFVSLLFFIIFIFIGIGVYSFFKSGFYYVVIQGEGELRDALVLFLSEVFLLIITLLLFFSSVISIIFSLFKEKKYAALISSPAMTTVPLLSLYKSFKGSLLSFILLCTPLAFAYSSVFHLPSTSSLLLLTVLLAFVFSVHALAFLYVLFATRTLIMLGYVFYKKYFLSLFAIVGFFAGTCSVVGLFLWNRFSSVDIFTLFKVDAAEELLSLERIISLFSFSPSHGVALFMTYIQTHNFVLLVSATLTIVGMAIFLGLSIYLSRAYFYLPWLLLQEGKPQALHSVNNKKNNIESFFLRGDSPLRIIFNKEALTAFRDYRGILWSLFLMSIWLTQIITSVVLNQTMRKYGISLEDRSSYIQAMEFIIAVYFIASFTLRFVVPSFSIEKKALWIIGSAPISITTIIKARCIFYSLLFLLLQLGMSITMAYILTIPLVSASIQTILLSITTILIVILGVSFGSLFPNTESDDPEIVTTSASGLAFTSISLICGGVLGYTLYIALTTGVYVYLVTLLCIFVSAGGILYIKTLTTVRKRTALYDLS